MEFVFYSIVTLVMLITLLALRKQKLALTDFDNRIKLLESFKTKFYNNEEDEQK